MSEEFVQSMQATEVAEASAVKKSTKKSGKIGNKRGAAGTAIIYTILGIYTLFLMAPFLVIIVTSFTPDSEYLEASSYIWFPSHFSLEGYQAVFLEDPYAVDGIPSLLRGFINSMWITLIPLVSGLFMSCLVSYCYSKNRFPAKNTLFMITVTTMFIPLGAFSFVSADYSGAFRQCGNDFLSAAVYRQYFHGDDRSGADGRNEFLADLFQDYHSAFQARHHRAVYLRLCRRI